MWHISSRQVADNKRGSWASWDAALTCHSAGAGHRRRRRQKDRANEEVVGGRSAWETCRMSVTERDLKRQARPSGNGVEHYGGSDEGRSGELRGAEALRVWEGMNALAKPLHAAIERYLWQLSVHHVHRVLESLDVRVAVQMICSRGVRVCLTLPWTWDANKAQHSDHPPNRDVWRSLSISCHHLGRPAGGGRWVRGFLLLSNLWLNETLTLNFFI